MINFFAQPLMFYKSLVFTALSVFSISLLFLPSLASAGERIVTCTGLTCDFCELLATTNNVIGWLVTIASLIAGLVIVYAGFKMVTAGGDTSGYVEAKKLLVNAVIGIIIVLATAAVIFTIMQTTLKEEVTVVDVITGKFSTADCGGMTNQQNAGMTDLKDKVTSGGGGRRRDRVSVPNIKSDYCLKQGGNINPSTGLCEFPITPGTPPATINSDYKCDSSPDIVGTIYDCSAGIAACTLAGFGFEVYKGNNRVRCTPAPSLPPPQTLPTPDCPDGTVINGICYDSETRPDPENPNQSVSQSIDIQYDGSSMNNTTIRAIINGKLPDREILLIESVGIGVDLNVESTKTEYRQNCSQEGRTIVFFTPSNNRSGGYVVCLR